jgi:hypothetical protein
VAQYLKFLPWLIAFGKNLPAILDALETLLNLLSPEPVQPGESGTLAMTEATFDGECMTAEVLDAEAQVLALTVPEGSQAIGDGSRLRRIFTFLKDSGLLDLLLSRIPTPTGG